MCPDLEAHLVACSAQEWPPYCCALLHVQVRKSSPVCCLTCTHQCRQAQQLALPASSSAEGSPPLQSSLAWLCPHPAREHLNDSSCPAQALELADKRQSCLEAVPAHGCPTSLREPDATQAHELSLSSTYRSCVHESRGSEAVTIYRLRKTSSSRPRACDWCGQLGV